MSPGLEGTIDVHRVTARDTETKSMGVDHAGGALSIHADECKRFQSMNRLTLTSQRSYYPVRLLPTGSHHYIENHRTHVANIGCQFSYCCVYRAPYRHSCMRQVGWTSWTGTQRRNSWIPTQGPAPVTK